MTGEKTQEPTKVLVVDDSILQARVIGDALRGAGYQIQIANSGEDALKLAQSWQPDAITLDVVMPGMSGYQVCRALREQEGIARVPVIMVTSRGGIEAKVAGFEAGADDYLVKPVDAAELFARLKVLLRRAQRAEYAVTRTGELIAVFSLRGGVGVTALAANLAVTLSGLWSGDVPLIDLALTMGQVALTFNIKPTVGIQDLAQREPGALDDDAVESCLYRHPTGVRILSAPMSPEGAEMVSSTHVNVILPLLKDHYPYLVADLASDFQEVTLTALDHADQIVLVLAPELASVRAAAGALNVFASLGYPNEKIKLVLNWTFRRHGLRQKNIEAAMHRPIDLELPFAPDVFIPSLNRGVPLVVGHLDSEITAQIEEFAFRLTRPERLPGPGEEMTPMLARVRERLGV
jgi:pilus assembly protein CpaE